MKAMCITTHEDDNSIPKGMAVLSINNEGFIGTNNGWPHAGQPALFPQNQAHAICYAWNTYDLHSMPCPENVDPAVLEWLT